ncbi:MAG: Uma2 family endonuclease [Anaerolinea sp.]|nr:Uma2 family endonuclease [Anaerolinea sp.]
MVVQAVEKFVDEDELMALGSNVFAEVIDGEMVEMSPVGTEHHIIVMNLLRILDAFVISNLLGYVFPDGLIYLLDADGKHLRGAQVPDVSFVRKGTLPKDWDIKRPYPGSPALAVEVLSPDDKPELLLKRVRKYLQFGSEQVWVVYPDSKEVHQYKRGADTIRVYTGSDTLEVDDLFPGLTLTLTDIFAMPDLSEGES